MKNMSDRFHKKYRIPSIRLQNYDYSSNGFYFITICTKDKKNYFGEIINDKICLSEIGTIAKTHWFQIPKHFSFVTMDEFVVMPNHVHGIVIINNKGLNKKQYHVETQNIASLQEKNTFGPQSNNLASIIRGYKASVKAYATINQINFSWQSRFYDHIIRSERSFFSICEYIRNNPRNWGEDSENTV